MLRPFESLDGPTFLALYLFIAIATVIVAEVFVRRTHPTPSREPELFELAWLNGGEKSVMVTSNLLADEFPKTREASNPRPLYRTALNDPLHGLAQLARGNTDNEAAHRAAVTPIGPYFEALDNNLVQAGFRRANPARDRRIVWLIFAPALVLGLLRLFSGLSLGNPIGFLVVMLFVLVFVAYRYSVRVKRLPMHKHFKKLNNSVRKDKTLKDRPEELPWAFAVGGGAVLWAFSPALAHYYGVTFSPGALSGSTVADVSPGDSHDSGSCGSSCGGGCSGGCGG